MQELLVVTGPPGAGKSTIAAMVAGRFDRSVLIEGDSFFGFIARGAIAPWLEESHEQNDVVVTAAAAATGAFVRGGFITVYDGVLGPWFLDQFLMRSGLAGLHYALLLPSEDACVERVRTRLGHGFTDETATRKMHAAFGAAAVEDRHVFVTDDRSAEQTVDQLVESLRAGSLRYTL